MEIKQRQKFLVVIIFVSILSTAIIEFTFKWSVRNKHKPSVLNVLVFTLYTIYAKCFCFSNRKVSSVTQFSLNHRVDKMIECIFAANIS